MLYEIATEYTFNVAGEQFVVGPDDEVDNHVGYVQDLNTSVYISENTTNVVGADRAIVGPMTLGSRTTVFDISNWNGDRLARHDALRRIYRILRSRKGSEGYVDWKGADGNKWRLYFRISQYPALRHQVPGPRKDLQVQLVSGSPLIVSPSLHVMDPISPGSVQLYNYGDEVAPFRAYLYGPFTKAELVNDDTDQKIVIDYTVPSGQYIQVDTEPGYESVRLNGLTNLYEYVDVFESEFFGLIPGTPNLIWTPTGGAGNCRIEWRSSTL